MKRCFFLAWPGCLFLALLAVPGGRGDEVPPEVQVVRPISREVTEYADFTGRIEAVRKADLRARVTGYVLKVNVDVGDRVKEGDLLFEIDPSVYKAELAVAEAKLGQAKANVDLAEKDYARAVKLLESRAISKEEFDRFAAMYAEAKAQLEVARANRDLVQLNLGFTRVTAPFNGRLVRRDTDPGNLARADETSLGVLTSVDPVQAVFDIDERTVLEFSNRGAGKEKSFPVSIGLANEKGFPHEGGKANLDVPQVDPTNGTARVRVPFSNPDGLLIPGLFVRVRLTTGKLHKALLVPQEAIRKVETKVSIMVVSAKDVLEERAILLGQEFGNLREVKKGLKPEDRILLKFDSDLAGKKVNPGETKPSDPDPKKP